MDLTGKLLIASAGMTDPRFGRTVIFMNAYTSEGAMGMIINRPMPNLSLASILEPENFTPTDKQRMEQINIYEGGPVETVRGFVLHSDDFVSEKKSISIASGFMISTTQDILEALAKGVGPSHAIIALGYAGWAGGQLEFELTQNAWLVADPSVDLVFGTRNTKKWTMALESIGVSPLALSATSGHA